MANKSVLVVDADARSLRVVEVSLRKAGYIVTTAGDGEKGFDVAKANPPDLVIADTMLPKVSGFELRERFRARPELRDVPFVYLSSNGDDATRARAKDLGASEFMTKPTYIRELLACVALTFERRQRDTISRQVSRDASEFSGSLADVGVIELVQLFEPKRERPRLPTEPADRTSGVVRIASRFARAAIYIRDGAPIDAELGTATGMRAFSRALTLNEGRFNVEFRTVRRDPRIFPAGGPQGDGATHTDGELILLEGLRYLEDWNAAVRTLPRLESIYGIEVSALLGRLENVPDDRNLLIRGINGRRQIYEILDVMPAGADDIGLLKALEHMIADGLVRVVGQAVEPPETQADPISPPSTGYPGPNDDYGPSSENVPVVLIDTEAIRARADGSASADHHSVPDRATQRMAVERNPLEKPDPIPGTLGASKSDGAADEGSATPATGIGITAAALLSKAPAPQIREEAHGAAAKKNFAPPMPTIPGPTGQTKQTNLAKTENRPAIEDNPASAKTPSVEPKTPIEANPQLLTSRHLTLPSIQPSKVEQAAGAKPPPPPPPPVSPPATSTPPAEEHMSKRKRKKLEQAARAAGVSAPPAAVSTPSSSNIAMSDAGFGTLIQFPSRPGSNSEQVAQTAPSISPAMGASPGSSSDLAAPSTDTLLVADYFRQSSLPQPPVVQERWDDIVPVASSLSAGAKKGLVATIGIAGIATAALLGFQYYQTNVMPAPVDLASTAAEPPTAAEVSAKIRASNTISAPQGSSGNLGATQPVDPNTANAAQVESGVLPENTVPPANTAQVENTTVPANADPSNTAQVGNTTQPQNPANPTQVAPVVTGDANYEDALTNALRLARRGRRTAAAAFDAALAINPTGTAALSGYAMFYLTRSRNEEAAALAERAVAADASNAEGWIVLGSARQALGHRHEAREAYRHCVSQGTGKFVNECRAMAASIRSQ